MKPLRRFRNLSVTQRVPLISAALMILPGLVATRQRIRDAPLRRAVNGKCLPEPR
ncbi:MAG: hypothetical protein ACEQSU_04080 [Microgenomates group bacterium]